MATLHRTLASLRLIDDELQPHEVTALLGTSPTFGYAKGDVLTSRVGTSRIARTGCWGLETDETSPADLDAQVQQLLAQVTGDLAVWRDLRARFEIDIYWGWFMNKEIEGTYLESASLEALAARGIALSFDLYSGPEDD